MSDIYCSQIPYIYCNGILQGLALGSVLFNTSVSHVDNRTLSNVPNSTKLCGALNTLRGWDSIQRSYPGLGESEPQIQAGQGMDQEQPWVEDFHSVGGQEAQYEPEKCTSSPEIQPHPGLYQRQCGKQGKGGDSALPLGPCEASLQCCIQLCGR